MFSRLYCRMVPTSCRNCDLGAAKFHLVNEALAKVFEVGDSADLKRVGGSPTHPLQVGDVRFLKNFRKGLIYQLGRCRSEVAVATARGDHAAVQAAEHRLEWIFDKQRRLDEDHEMVTDRPSWQQGRHVDYGCLDDVGDSKQDSRREGCFGEETNAKESVAYIDPRHLFPPDAEGHGQ